MSDLFGAATVFILAFLGLIGVAVLIFFLWLAYRYDISFSIRTKEKTKTIPPPADPGKHESVS